MTTSSVPNQAAPDDRRSPTLNWVLALCTLPAAAALAGLAYLKVLGSAGCSGDTCPRGPADLIFTLATYGAPILAVLTVAISFVTARRARGIAVPVLAWLLLLAIGAAVLLTIP